MSLFIVILAGAGILLIYYAVTGKKPQEVIAQALGGK